MPLRLGLLPKLALFFLALALPALLALDYLRGVLEFRALTAQLETEAMSAEVRREQQALARHLRDRALGDVGTARDLERWVLRLARRANPVLGDHALTLAEQPQEPIRAFLVDGSGHVRVSSNTGDWSPVFSDWLATWLASAKDDLRRHRIGDAFIWVVRLKGIPDRFLVLQVILDDPATALFGRTRIEWPIMLIDGLLFALASAFFLRAWVTARLSRMRAAAVGWREGNLATRIADRSGDEIGAISAELDRVPDALEALMQARAALAGADERARLARDLHDTVKQKTFGLSMQLAAMESGLSPQQQPAALAECRALVADIQHSLVAIIDDLKPLPDLPLGLRLQQDIEAWSRRSGIAVLIDLSGADAVRPEHATHVAAILTEALANVQKHAGARRVDVALRQEQDRLVLLIEDDGRGGARPGAGRGLEHLASRAADMPRGHCQIDSSNTGTRIRIHWHG